MNPPPPIETAIDPAWIDEAVDLFRGSRSVLFITGAGLSADSGLPTYRGIGGLYDGRDAEEDLPIEALLSGETLRDRPALTWRYLLQVERAGRHARPNRGHEVIAAMEAQFERVWVLTQNVDGFHRRAGSSNVVDVHGDLHEIRCTRCAFRKTVEDYAGFTVPPSCTRCGGLLRPEVVLFGEPLMDRHIELYQTEISRPFDLVVSVGTTSVFPYIAAPVVEARRRGKPTIEINPGRSEVSDVVTLKIPHSAAGTLDAVWKGIGPKGLSQPLGSS